jgi:hypothetical protein
VTWDWVTQAAPGVVALLAGAFGLARGQGKLRSSIRFDVETAAKLPEGSAAHDTLMVHIETQLKELTAQDTERRRDWTGFTLGVIFALSGGYGTVWFFQHSDWWRWFGLITAFAATLGLYGMVEGPSRKKRDHIGRAIE